MNDKIATLQELKSKVKEFVDERDWAQFHAPKNMSMVIAAEAAELMEKFLWCSTQGSFDELEKNRYEVENEIADILGAVLNFANATGIDVSTALERKLALTAKRYPIEKCKGKSLKYTQL